MKKRMMLMLLLMLAALVLASCQSGSNNTPYTVMTNAPAQNLYATAVPAVDNSTEPLMAEDEYTDFDSGSYDPGSEESLDVPEDMMGDLTAGDTPTMAPTISSEYAGATPVVIDPIDKPTPTPLPPLSFTYQVYSASKLHLSFEAPVGWMIDDSSSDTFVLTNPDTAIDYPASITVRAVSVNSQYDASDLKKEIKQMLDTIGAAGFSSYSPSNTASRTLLDKEGVYANYKGTLDTGAKVAGRVHATCINKVLYTVHVTYPQDYTSTYVDGPYNQFRHTVAITQ